jgi:hypothetical protein
VIDVGGVVVTVAAADAYAAMTANRLGEVAADGPAEIDLVARAVAPRPPDAVEPTDLEGFRCWTTDDELWVGDDDVMVRVAASSVEVGGPIGTIDLEDRYDDLLQFGIAIAVASPKRIMLHGAVIARDGEAMLLVGGSGAGKSTLAAAALVGGWELLGDDLCVFRPESGRIQSVRRPAFVPGEVADRHGLEGEREVGPRDRVELPLDRLALGDRRLIGIVRVDHGIDGAVHPRTSGDLNALNEALAVPPYPAVIRRHLAAGSRLIALPSVLLEHARDLDRRVPRAIELLDEAWAGFVEPQ